ncbi:MAG: PAS domain S-box protein [Balneolaceae bacterium]|nr:PAS domain S-box protein [Balneolaceae bacterium]
MNKSDRIVGNLEKVSKLLESTNGIQQDDIAKIRELLDGINEEIQERTSGKGSTNELGIDLYQTIFEKSPIGILHYNEKGEITICNKRFTEILGTTSDKIIGLNMTELPDVKIVEAVKKALDGKKSEYEGKYRSVTSGKTVPVRVIFHPLNNTENNLGDGIAMIEDITERYNARKKLIESENRYHSLFENKHIIMLVIDPDSGQILDANPAAIEFYGWPRETLKKMKISDIDTLSPEEINQEIDGAKNEKRNVFHFKHRLADGSVRDVEVFTGLNKKEGKLVLFSIVHDITTRVRAEKELLKFKLGIERSPNIIFITDKDGYFQYVNPSFQKKYGYTIDELEGKTPRVLKSGVQTDDFYEEFWETILDGQVMEGEIMNRTKGGDLLDIKFSSNPIIDENEELMGFIAIQEDISEKKKKDRQLRKSLKEKEVLLSEIHHRVKNNLAVISALLELNLYQGDEMSVEEYIQSSQLRIKTMANVHEMFYQSESFASISFGKYIERLISTIQSSLQPNTTYVEFETDLNEAELNINQAVPCGLIINELITNSLKHAFPGKKEGKVCVTLDSDNDTFILIIEDNGIGLPDGFNIETAQDMGMTLVRILSKQLEADLTVNNSKEGVAFTITFQANDTFKGSISSLSV